NGNSYYKAILTSASKQFGFSMDTPVRDIDPDKLKLVLHGTGKERLVMRHVGKSGRVHEYRTQYEGVIPNIERRFRETESDFVREELSRYMAPRPCPTCKGAKLKPEVLAITMAGRNINEVTSYSVGRAMRF